jgi:hypothetical protein
VAVGDGVAAVCGLSSPHPVTSIVQRTVTTRCLTRANVALPAFTANPAPNLAVCEMAPVPSGPRSTILHPHNASGGVDRARATLSWMRKEKL